MNNRLIIALGWLASQVPCSWNSLMYSSYLYLFFRALLSECRGVRGFCPLLCGDSRALLTLHGGQRTWRRVISLFLLTHSLVLPTRGFPQGRVLEESTPLPGGLHGDADVRSLYPGTRDSQAGTERYSRCSLSSLQPCLMLKVFIILWIPSHCTGLFEVRAQDYLDSLPGAEHRGVNKFLKGLGKLSSTFQIKKLKRFFLTVWLETSYWMKALFLQETKWNFFPKSKESLRVWWTVLSTNWGAVLQRHEPETSWQHWDWGEKGRKGERRDLSK